MRCDKNVWVTVVDLAGQPVANATVLAHGGPLDIGADAKATTNAFGLAKLELLSLGGLGGGGPFSGTAAFTG